MNIYNLMQQNLQLISQFITSEKSIFNLTKIDYPTYFEQHLIISYFQFHRILSKEHNQIMKIFHTANQRLLDLIVSGIIYTIMLNPQTSQQHIQHLKNIKIQGWSIATNILQQILRQIFDKIKPQCRLGLGVVYNQLFLYHIVNDDLTIMILKSIDCYDISQNNFTYINFLLQIFQQILERYSKSQNTEQTSEQIKTLCSFLFYKLIRLVVLIYLINEQSIEQFKETCRRLIYFLWNHHEKQSLSYGYELTRYLQELQKFRQYQELSNRIRQKLVDSDSDIKSWRFKETFLSVVLPIKVETTLIFIKNQKIDRQSIWIQMNWVWKQRMKRQINPYFILPDIARWTLCSSLTIQQKVYILEWVLYKGIQNLVVYQFIKQVIFIDWYQDLSFQYVFSSLQLLSYLISINSQFSEDLIVYILRQYERGTLKERIRNIFYEANHRQVLKVSMIKQSHISQRTKTDLNQLFQSVIEKQQPLQFDPSENSIEQINYEEYDSNEFHTNQPEPQHLIQKQQIYTMQFEQQFVEDMDLSLLQLLDDPNEENLIKLMEKFLQILKQYKKESENDQIQMIIQQTAKTIYIMFNKQFEEFHTSENLQAVYYILKNVVDEWKTNNFKSQMYRKLVKKLIELFPITEYSFCKSFFENFKRAVNTKDFCQWLIPREKSIIIFKRLHRLMENNINSILENAASFGIHYKK